MMFLLAEFRRNQLDEFVAGLLLLEFSSEGRSCSSGVLLLHTTHHHAEMLGLDDHRHTMWL